MKRLLIAVSIVLSIVASSLWSLWQFSQLRQKAEPLFLVMEEAAGTTKVINLTSNITSLIIYIVNGKVIFYLGIVAGLFSIAGNYIGAKFFTNKGAKILRPIIISVLVIFFCKILIENFIP